MQFRKTLSFPLCALALAIAACGGGSTDPATDTEDNAVAENPGNGPAIGAAAPAEEQTTEPVTQEVITVVAETEDIIVPDTFDWASNGELSLAIQLHDAEGNVAAQKGVWVYVMPEQAVAENMREPFDDEITDVGELFFGVSNAEGQVIADIQVPGHVLSTGHVYVRTKLIGFAATAIVPITSNDADSLEVSWSFGPNSVATEVVDEIDPNVLQPDFDPAEIEPADIQPPTLDPSLFEPIEFEGSVSSRSATSGIYYLNPFDQNYHWHYGHMPAMEQAGACDVTTATTPGQLCRSTVDSEEAALLGQIFQQGSQPTDKYLNADSSLSNLIFDKKANVIVSFLQEGAGYQNTFGFYTYNSAAVPTDPNQLDSARILFPNTSFQGSGGYMFAGDSVSLGEFDPSLGDDSIGFWVAAHGWGNGNGIGYQGHHFYSISELNPEADPEQRKHLILVANSVDEVTNTRRLWVTMEDIRLDLPYSDRDYNDLIVQIDVFPADALVFGDLIPDVTDEDNTIVDADADGVLASDDIDDNDSQRAFERYYPGENVWGTLLAEDNWPALGDFDMNDLVVRYRTREVLDSNMNIKDIEINYKLVARGAAFHNGFGVSFGEQVFGDNIMSATLNGEDVQPMSDSSALVYEIFADAWDYTDGGDAVCWTFNTVSECAEREPSEFDLHVTFSNTVAHWNLLSAPYNPFLMATKVSADAPGYNRANAFNNELYSENGEVKDIEIHLPNQLPTQGQDLSMFGTGDDASDGIERFYVSTGNLPWIIDIPDSVQYPEEFQDISQAYPTFASWVISGGAQFQDWYRNPSDDLSLVYQAED